MTVPTPDRVALNLYGGVIETFFSRVQLAHYKRSAARIEDRQNFPWQDLLKERAEHPFPGVSQDSLRHDYQPAYFALIIEVLNTTERETAFKVAINTMLMAAQGASYQPFYRGMEYDPGHMVEFLSK